MNEPESNNLLATLQRHRGGQVLSEGSKKLQELVAAVAMTGKPGTLTIKLKVSQASRGNAAVVLQDSVVMKEPKMEAEASFWFATEGGELRKDDPRQQEIPFRPITGGMTDEGHTQARSVAG